jgi:cation diffusion facilitator CzcD-associated flavoprotein CzcO
MVVGNGHSAVQIASDTCMAAANVINVFKEPRVVVPNWRYSQTKDVFQLMTFYILPSIRDRELMYKGELNNTNFFSQYIELIKEQSTIPELEVEDSEELPEIAFSNTYLDYVKDGFIKPIRAEVKFIDGNFVHLSNGQTHEVDSIILCTGYKPNFSFLDENLKTELNYDPENKSQPVSLERNWVYNHGVKNLSFVGCLPFDVIFCTFELQSKLALQYFTHKDYSSHLENQMKNGLKTEEYDFYEPTSLIDILAEELNILPDLELIKEYDKSLYEMVYTGPFLYDHYALNRVNYKTEKWERAVNYIKSINNSE